MRMMTTWTSEGPEPPSHTLGPLKPPATQPPPYVGPPCLPGWGLSPLRGAQKRPSVARWRWIEVTLYRPASFSMKR